MAKGRTKRIGTARWLLLGVLFLLLVALILNRYVFVVRNVEIYGEGPVTAEDVIRSSGLQIGASIFRTDTSAIRSGIEASGQLQCVEISRSLPDTIRITVQSRALSALIRNAGTLVGIDVNGVVLGQYTDMPEAQIPFITGLSQQVFSAGQTVSASEETLLAIEHILSGLKSAGMTEVVYEIDVSAIDELTLYTRDGMLILLGDYADMTNKFSWMKSALADLEERGVTRGRLDVSSGKMADYHP